MKMKMKTMYLVSAFAGVWLAGWLAVCLSPRWKYLIMRLPPHDKSAGVDELPLQCKTSLATVNFPAHMAGGCEIVQTGKWVPKLGAVVGWSVFIGKLNWEIEVISPCVAITGALIARIDNNGQTFIDNENKQSVKWLGLPCKLLSYSCQLRVFVYLFAKRVCLLVVVGGGGGFSINLLSIWHLYAMNIRTWGT